MLHALTPTWALLLHIFTGSSCSAACVFSWEMLMCALCRWRICIPGETLGAEAGERNESCAVNHSLPRRQRGMQKATTPYKKINNPHQPYTHSTEVRYIFTCSDAVCSTDALQDEGLSHANWMTHFHSAFSHTLAFHRQSDFLTKLFCALAYLFSQTCTYGCQSWEMLEGEDAKWKGGHTKTHCSASSFHCRAFHF